MLSYALQGGPGGSGTGFGNFGEIGPLDVNLQPRNTSWTQAANILFIDNPVGSGYSYTDDDSAFTTDVDQIAKDLLTLFSDFLKNHQIFQVLFTLDLGLAGITSMLVDPCTLK